MIGGRGELSRKVEDDMLVSLIWMLKRCAS
jgi:hypothetical protein